MVEIKVDRTSKFGVMVDGKWLNWSKGVVPPMVVKGDSLDVTLDSKGKIVYAEKLGVSSPPIQEVPFNVDSVRSREILKGQCLNIVFAKLDGNIGSAAWRTEAISITAVLFEELELAGYLKW
jgi:hypothetical protein